MTKALYIFTRDLRIEDNKCLADAVMANDIVYPIFILTPQQVKNNPYYNKRAVNFMCKSIKELAKSIPLCIYENATIEEIIKTTNINAIYINGDVSPFAVQREKHIAQICKQNSIKFYVGRDVYLCRSRELLRTNGKPYLKYTPFYDNARGHVRNENIIRARNLHRLRPIGSQNLSALSKYEFADTVCNPGRKAAIRALRTFCRHSRKYSQDHDYPAKSGTSHLAAYLHFGVLGPLEVARAVNRPDYTKQLLWREFYLYISKYTHPDYSKRSYTLSRHIKWKNSVANFKKWCAGQTGCPIVDAGMRELNKTGYMHNRVRMIVAMYLVFYLQINWTWGEKYFAQNLCDYDYANNLGGWMWCASWESWSNDYFRIFSMSSQMHKYDHDAIYVKKWIPELQYVAPRDLYNWRGDSSVAYAKPIIADLDAARANGIKWFKSQIKN